MELFQVAVLISVIIGIIIVVVSLVFIKDQDGKVETADYGINTENTLKAINESVSEAEKVLDELDKTSVDVFNELNEKYQELLFLYSMVDEKKVEIAGKVDVAAAGVPPKSQQGYVPKGTIGNSVMNIFNKERFIQVSELLNSGLSHEQVAKKLGIGVGEVKLILDLGRINGR